MEKSVLNLVDAYAGSLRALRLVEMTEDLENDYTLRLSFRPEKIFDFRSGEI